ncbi:MAG: beta-galactosidase, partial [Pseudomonadota bacterium]
TALAQRYGQHPSLIAWQTDNEYGCHDTVLSFSESAAAAFRVWCREKYGDIDALNRAWGNVFWSMEYRSFDALEPPNLTVTEANPAHWLDYRRFASDEVVRFNREQVDILRERSPGRAITHNFMGFFTEFDHYAVARDLDIATWDSYPLGFLEQFWFDETTKREHRRQGHPDIAAFHHDLYRGCAGGRWGVMEQQPGPVNWARANAKPEAGMITLWTMEAMAHGAEFTSYFRWRQARFAQEQMHAGLLRPDNADAPAAEETRTARDMIAAIGPQEAAQAPVALVFSYEAAWVIGIQPQSADFLYLMLVFEWYCALRRKGLDIDIVGPDASLDAYSAVFIPTLPIVSDAFVAKLAALQGPVVIGPRTGSRTSAFAIPAELPPGPLQRILPIKVTAIDSIRQSSHLVGGTDFDEKWGINSWFEDIETRLEPELTLNNGAGAVFRKGNLRYLAGLPDHNLLEKLIRMVAEDANLALMDLPETVRVRRTQTHTFAFNFSREMRDLSDVFGHLECLFGSPVMDGVQVSIWRHG